MRTDLLFGTSFAANDQMKAALLNHFITWKTQALKEYDQLVAMDLAVPYEKPAILDFREVKCMLLEQDCRHYYITKPAVDIANRIKLEDPFDLNNFLSLANGKKQLSFGDEFIRYDKQGSRVQVMAAKTYPNAVEGKNWLNYSFFWIDLENKKMSDHHIRPVDEGPPNKAHSFIEFEHHARRQFYQLTTFLELAPLEEIFLPPGLKHGTKKSEDNLLNREKFPVTIVNSTWNKTIRSGAFGVQPHKRMQAHGPGLSLRKPILVPFFFKRGYNLNAGKLQEQQKTEGMLPRPKASIKKMNPKWKKK